MKRVADNGREVRENFSLPTPERRPSKFSRISLRSTAKGAESSERHGAAAPSSHGSIGKPTKGEQLFKVSLSWLSAARKSIRLWKAAAEVRAAWMRRRHSRIGAGWVRPQASQRSMFSKAISKSAGCSRRWAAVRRQRCARSSRRKWWSVALMLPGFSEGRRPSKQASPREETSHVVRSGSTCPVSGFAFFLSPVAQISDAKGAEVRKADSRRFRP